jgi:hypothetical protein
LLQKNSTSFAFFPVATNSVAFFGWIKNDVMKEKRFSGKFSCCRSFSSLEIVSKLARTVRVGEMRCVAMWCVGEEMLRGGEETSTDESILGLSILVECRNEGLMGWKRCDGIEAKCVAGDNLILMHSMSCFGG